MNDKLMHFLVGIIIATAVIVGTGSIIYSVVMVTAVAIAKEIYDSFHPKTHTAELLDVIATVAGCIPVIIAVLMLTG